MDRYCSDCNTATVRSSVGYMCPGCGRLHQFDKADALTATRGVQTDSFLDTVQLDRNDYNSHFTDLTAPPKPSTKNKVSDDPKAAKSAKTHHKKKVKHKHSSEQPASIKRTMKRLLVPELPAPHYHKAALATNSGGSALMPSPALPTEATDDIESSQPVTPKPPVASEPQQQEKVMPVAASVPLAVAAGAETEALAEKDDHIMHAQAMQEQLEDTSSTNVLHVIAITVAAILLVVAIVLAFVVLSH